MEIIVRTAQSLRRNFTRLRRRQSRLRHAVPLGMAQTLMGVAALTAHLRPYYVDVRARSRYTNLFHCCIQKTGSQWLRSIFTDVRTFQYSGLLHHRYSRKDRQSRADQAVTERQFPEPLPVGRIITPLYVTYDNFLLIPQQGSYRAVFIMRDPRDLVVSWYFSARYNHLVNRNMSGSLNEARRHLSSIGQTEGLSWSVRYLAEQGRFAALESWAHARDDENILIVRFEDLAAQSAFAEFERIFAFFDIRMPKPMLRELVDAYSFRRLSGRDRDRENTRSHLRGGPAGNWRRYFTAEIERQFYQHTGDLVSHLGYA